MWPAQRFQGKENFVGICRCRREDDRPAAGAHAHRQLQGIPRQPRPWTTRTLAKSSVAAPARAPELRLPPPDVVRVRAGDTLPVRVPLSWGKLRPPLLSHARNRLGDDACTRWELHRAAQSIRNPASASPSRCVTVSFAVASTCAHSSRWLARSSPTPLYSYIATRTATQTD